MADLACHVVVAQLTNLPHIWLFVRVAQAIVVTTCELSIWAFAGEDFYLFLRSSRRESS